MISTTREATKLQHAFLRHIVETAVFEATGNPYTFTAAQCDALIERCTHDTVGMNDPTLGALRLPAKVFNAKTLMQIAAVRPDLIPEMEGSLGPSPLQQYMAEHVRKQMQPMYDAYAKPDKAESLSDEESKAELAFMKKRAAYFQNHLTAMINERDLTTSVRGLISACVAMLVNKEATIRDLQQNRQAPQPKEE